MVQVHFVKSARRDWPEYGIKKGESYYWWQFAFSRRSVSRTQPNRRQLTRSDFQIAIYDIEDALGGLVADDSIESQVEEIADQMESLADEQEDKRSNMPDQLQDSEVGSMLEERADALRQWAEELRGLDLDIEGEDPSDYEEEAGEELGYDLSEEGLREEALHQIGIVKEQVVTEDSPGEGEGPRVPEADVKDKMDDLRRDMESEVKDRAQQMADERKEERIQEIIDEAQGTSYEGP